MVLLLLDLCETVTLAVHNKLERNLRRGRVLDKVIFGGLISLMISYSNMKGYIVKPSSLMYSRN